MSYYIRFLITDDKSTTLAELEKTLQTFNADYTIDANIIVLDNEECGQIEINQQDGDVFHDDLTLLKEFAERRRHKDVLLAAMNRTREMIVVQPIGNRSDHNTFRTLEPLFDWLLANRTGLLVVEGGSFYNNDGQIT